MELEEEAEQLSVEEELEPPESQGKRSRSRGGDSRRGSPAKGKRGGGSKPTSRKVTPVRSAAKSRGSSESSLLRVSCWALSSWWASSRRAAVSRMNEARLCAGAEV